MHQPHSVAHWGSPLFAHRSCRPLITPVQRQPHALVRRRHLLHLRLVLASSAHYSTLGLFADQIAIYGRFGSSHSSPVTSLQPAGDTPPSKHVTGPSIQRSLDPAPPIVFHLRQQRPLPCCHFVPVSSLKSACVAAIFRHYKTWFAHQYTLLSTLTPNSDAAQESCHRRRGVQVR